MQLPSTVSPGESLARYLTQHNHFHLPTCSVKSKVFEPPPDLRLSVFRIDGLDIKEVWENGLANVVNLMPQPHNLYGMASIKASAAEEVHLDIDPDNTPPRHACIVGWPQEKSERMLIAQKLAARAKLILRPQNQLLA